MSEREILQLLKNGNEEVIKHLHAEHYDGLCLYSSSIVKDHQAAEEIVEDLFIHLWLNSKVIIIKSSLKCYLYKSVHNNSIKFLKKKSKQSKMIEELHYTQKDQEILHSGSVFNSNCHLIVEELEEKAEQILLSLPEECKKIYSLNRFEELSYSNIAKKLNISVSTVKTQMRRAFQKFRAGLKDYLYSL